MGCVIQAGLGQNVARQSVVKAGLGYETTAETLNTVCGSGLDAVNSAARLTSVPEKLKLLLQVGWKACLKHHLHYLHLNQSRSKES